MTARPGEDDLIARYFAPLAAPEGLGLGDDVALGEDCTIQTHLFEDRVMKMGTIQIGSRVSVGSYTLVLYNTVLEDDVKVGDLSLVMKGEVLPKGTRWAGSPVRRNCLHHVLTWPAEGRADRSIIIGCSFHWGPRGRP